MMKEGEIYYLLEDHIYKVKVWVCRTNIKGVGNMGTTTGQAHLIHKR